LYTVFMFLSYFLIYQTQNYKAKMASWITWKMLKKYTAVQNWFLLTHLPLFPSKTEFNFSSL
jgi:hypothetical protein